MKITAVKASEILDSRGKSTIETELTLSDGSKGIASIPSGTSTGKYEAKYRPVKESINCINTLIKEEIAGKNFTSQQELDGYLLNLDGTLDKSHLGANTILSVSIAFCKASAASLPLPLYQYINRISKLGITKYTLPKLMTLIFEGGKHGDSNLTIQEFMYVLSELDQPAVLFADIKRILKEKGLDTDTGLEGAYSPNGVSNEEALEIMKNYNNLIPIALDVAESSRMGMDLDYKGIISNFNVKSIEDPFGEDAWGIWSKFTRDYGADVLVVGDDLTVTNPKRIKKACNLRACNAVIIKPNQVGTITEVLESVDIARRNGLKIIVSHRSGETNDSFIADLAVGVKSEYVKFGAPNRGERIAKYNRLLKIKNSL